MAGDVFASPPAEAILAAIRAVASPAGVFLLVANYTGAALPLPPEQFSTGCEQALQGLYLLVQRVSTGATTLLCESFAPGQGLWE